MGPALLDATDDDNRTPSVEGEGAQSEPALQMPYRNAFIIDSRLRATWLIVESRYEAA